MSPTWEKQANQDLDIFDARDREESLVKEQSSDGASKPKEASAEEQAVLAQLDGLSCFIEYISGRAEWLLKEWRDLKGELAQKVTFLLTCWAPSFLHCLPRRLGAGSFSSENFRSGTQRVARHL